MTEFGFFPPHGGTEVHRTYLVFLLRNASVRNARLVVPRACALSSDEPPPTFPFLESQCQRATSARNFQSRTSVPPCARSSVRRGKERVYRGAPLACQTQKRCFSKKNLSACGQGENGAFPEASSAAPSPCTAVFAARRNARYGVRGRPCKVQEPRPGRLRNIIARIRLFRRIPEKTPAPAPRGRNSRGDRCRTCHRWRGASSWRNASSGTPAGRRQR